MIKYCSADEAVKIIKSNDCVFVHGSAATPLTLLDALARRASELQQVQITAVSTLGDLLIADPAYQDSFYFNSLFVSENIRRAVQSGRGSYIPIFLSEIAQLFEQRLIIPDVALLHVSTFDKHGYCSLGASVDVALAGAHHAAVRIAQINPNMPRTHGNSFMHISQFDALVETHRLLPEVDYESHISDDDMTIGRYVAELVEDRSVLQMGIGTIPDAALKSMSHFQDLGVHTEMFSDGVMDLMKKGVVTNAYKQKYTGRTVSTFAIGSRELYSFIDDNPSFAFLEASYVNDIRTIRANTKVVAINSAIEVDITGQVVADSVGYYQFSGVGGQMDFIRGAALSEKGKPIIALNSVTRKGESKIVSHIREGGGVVTTRAHMHYLITEYGIAYLYGKNMQQRAYEILKIAHPKHRDKLEEEIIKRFGSKNHTVS